MNTLDRLIMTAMICINSFVDDFFKDEEGAVDLITIVVLIGIAVVLAIFFRDQLQSLLETLMKTISGNAESAVSQ